MRRLFFVCLLVVPVLEGAAAQRCVAQDPTALPIHYRLLPRLSTLHQSGGFAGFDLDYRLLGDYGFRPGSNTTPFAKFVDAEIWGSLISDGPAPAFVIDVDQILNLERLQGKLLPVASPFDVYEFQGKTPDGSSVNLYASLLGPWMYLRGATQPPPDSADYFEYQLKALARTRPFADWNSDGVVDASDYSLLRKIGAADGNDATGGATFADWRQQFGESLPNLAAMDAAISAAAKSGGGLSGVPEAASCGLAILAALFIAGVSRASRRR